MTVRLLRDAKIRHSAGEIVTVSPEEAFYLVSLGSAVEVEDKPAKVETEPKAAIEEPKKTIKKPRISKK